MSAYQQELHPGGLRPLRPGERSLLHLLSRLAVLENILRKGSRCGSSPTWTSAPVATDHHGHGRHRSYRRQALFRLPLVEALDMGVRKPSAEFFKIAFAVTATACDATGIALGAFSPHYLAQRSNIVTTSFPVLPRRTNLITLCGVCATILAILMGIPEPSAGDQSECFDCP